MRLSIVRKFLLAVVLCLALCPCIAFAEDAPKAQQLLSGDSSQLKYGDFIGSGWFIGTDKTLGKVYIYVPITSKGSWGTTSTGYLCNVGSSSWSGIMFTENGTLYNFNSTTFAYPRYRLANSSSYQYTDLHLSLIDSNLQVATKFPPAVLATESYPLILIGLSGVMILCLMRYRR